MKPTVISAEALFDEHRAALHWEWVAGQAHPERHFDEAAVRSAQSAADLVGYLNYIHPYRVQIVGRREVAYLVECTSEIAQRRISRIVALEPPVLIVADAQVPPHDLVALCDRADIPLFATKESAGHVIDEPNQRAQTAERQSNANADGEVRHEPALCLGTHAAQTEKPVAPDWLEAMEKMSDAGFAAYKALVHEDIAAADIGG